MNIKMGGSQEVSFSWKGFSVLFFLFCFLSMERLQIGSLNINGGRDRDKRGMVAELSRSKNIDVLLLQETHSSADNEVDWETGWAGQVFLNHGTSLSAGVAILFSQCLHLTNVSVCNVEQGRIQIIQVTIRDISFVFINVYAHTSGADRLRLFRKLNDKLKEFNSSTVIVMGGDWNCSTHHTVDRNSEEPHPPSASLLSSVVAGNDLTDVWRKLNPTVRQYTWVRAVEGNVRGARLDRIYINQTYNNRLLNSTISPVGFSDHHLVMADFSLQVPSQRRPYWHFSVRLIHDKTFCQWRLRKDDFENLARWREIGKAQIKIFCQQYMKHTGAVERSCFEELEKEVKVLEEEIISGSDGNSRTWEDSRKALGRFLHEKAKGALTKTRIFTIKDIDTPTSFFFKLEKRIRKNNMMMHLKLPNRTTTTDPVKMRKLATDFYTDLFSAGSCDLECGGDAGRTASAG